VRQQTDTLKSPLVRRINLYKYRFSINFKSFRDLKIMQAFTWLFFTW